MRLLAVLVLVAPLACVKNSTAPVAAPDPSLAQGTIATARPLPAGPGLTLTIGCEANFFVGPFAFQNSGESVHLVGSNRSANGDQVCAPGAEFVDGSGAFVSVAGFGCAEGTSPIPSESSYEYSPANGGNGANPVYLHVQRHDPPGCVATTITLARR